MFIVKIFFSTTIQNNFILYMIERFSTFVIIDDDDDDCYLLKYLLFIGNCFVFVPIDYRLNFFLYQSISIHAKHYDDDLIHVQIRRNQKKARAFNANLLIRCSNQWFNIFYAIVKMRFLFEIAVTKWGNAFVARSSISFSYCKNWTNIPSIFFSLMIIMAR